MLHKQPDGVWRIDLQLGWDIDKEEENFKQLLKDRDSGYAKYVTNPLLKDPFKIINNENFRDHLNEGAGSFNDLLKKKINYTFHEEFFSDDVLRNRMLNELFHEIVPVILFSDDLNSMMHSIDGRRMATLIETL